MKRYQDCNFLVRIYRRRHYLSIPLISFVGWYSNRKSKKDKFYLSFKDWWGLSEGLAQSRMNWVHDWKDVKKRLLNNRDKNPDKVSG
jgi:hypothetical protein